ncbi:MAG: penicillin-binding protein [Oscillospiraceae bacterium]|nr:penicillin-binding protein [Oscillospiraceae bacterium]
MWKRIAVVIGYLICLGVMVGSAVLVALTMYLVDVTRADDKDLNLTNLQLSLTSIIYYQDAETGEYEEYQRLDGSENRIWVDLEDIPQHVIDAYIAVEDKDFYDHHGVDIVGTVAAMVNEYTPIKLFSSKRGASTITQQLVKNLTMDNSGSGIEGAFRKVREIYRAFALEKQYSKDEILEAYLNTLRLSHNWAGVQAGANNYFGKDVSELTIAEAASIAGITKNPSVYNPYSHPENNLERRDDILYFMHQQGKISTEEYEAALAEELVLNQDIRSKSFVNSYFTDMVIDQVTEDLMEKFSISRSEASKMIQEDGLKIYSTVDPSVQSAMEQVMLNEPGSNGRTLFPTKENTYKLNDGTSVTQTPQAAMVSVDYQGRIVGVVGGLGEKTEDRVLNRAVDSLRQTGSTMKPIGAYGPALEYDYIHYSTALFDDYIQEIDDPKEPTGKRQWPRNYNGEYTMQLTPVCYALAKSWNTIAVRTLMLMGVETSYDFLVNSVGISSLEEADKDWAPLALGGLNQGITPLEMAAAYAIFGNAGKYIEPYCYTTVEDSSGEVILETKVTSVQALSEETAYIMNRMMRNVLTYGTGGGLAPRYTDAVGKTGTATDDKDHWFIGVTPYYSTAVWMGYDNPATLSVNYGTHAPTTAWKQVTEAVHKNLTKKSFPVSKDVEMMNYCPITGNIANANCPDQQPGYYKKSTLENGFVVVCQAH